MKSIINIILLSALSVALFSCSPKEKAEAKEISNDTTLTERIFPVKVMDVATSEFERTEEYSATIKAWQEVNFAPSIPGRIKQILVEVGNHVKKGDLLVKMDETAYLQSKIQYEDSKRDFQRMDTLLSYGSTSQQNYDKSKMGYELSKTNYETMQDNTYLKAPFNGIITGKYFNDGELYTGMASSLGINVPCIISLMQIDQLKVLIDVSEQYWPVVKVGTKATLVTDIYPNEVFKGQVYRVYPTIDASTKTFKVEIKIENPGEQLRPGMFARVDLNYGIISSIVVPSNAVLKQQGTNERYVFVYNNGVAEKHVVELGRRFDEKIEIKEGLKKGEKLIVSGHSNLLNGAKVSVVE